MKIAVVTGASQGIGAAIAAGLSRTGYRVYDLSRTNVQKMGVLHLFCDVTNQDSVKKAFEDIIKIEGRIDLLINNAGMGVSGAVEFTPAEAVKKQMQVNFDGVVNCTRAVLPLMRKQHQGRIIFISSLAAVFPIPFQGFYSASKAAVSIFSETLRMEVKEFGIEVCTLLLGDVHSEFTKNREKTIIGDENICYHGRIQKAVSSMEKDERNGMSVDQVAAHLLRLLQKKKLPVQSVVGAKNRILYGLSKILSKKAQLWLLGKLYA